MWAWSTLCYRLWAVSTLPRKKDEVRAYHHGDLRHALVDAAVAAARVNGPEAVVVRDMARQVDVSHNAAYRHFAGREDLLTAVAEVGLGGLGATMRRELDATPRRQDPAERARQRLRAIGRAYVSYAMAEPGLFRAIWAAAQYPSIPAGPVPADDIDQAEISDPYVILNAVLDELVDAGAIPASHRRYSETVAWSAVHGLSMLIINGPLAGTPPGEIDDMLNRLCDVIDAGL
jgi:AcrR family transcriptional regulator